MSALRLTITAILLAVTTHISAQVTTQTLNSIVEAEHSGYLGSQLRLGDAVRGDRGNHVLVCAAISIPPDQIQRNDQGDGGTYAALGSSLEKTFALRAQSLSAQAHFQFITNSGDVELDWRDVRQSTQNTRAGEYHASSWRYARSERVAHCFAAEQANADLFVDEVFYGSLVTVDLVARQTAGEQMNEQEIATKLEGAYMAASGNVQGSEREAAIRFLQTASVTCTVHVMTGSQQAVHDASNFLAVPANFDALKQVADFTRQLATAVHAKPVQIGYHLMPLPGRPAPQPNPAESTIVQMYKAYLSFSALQKEAIGFQAISHLSTQERSTIDGVVNKLAAFIQKAASVGRDLCETGQAHVPQAEIDQLRNMTPLSLDAFYAASGLGAAGTIDQIRHNHPHVRLRLLSIGFHPERFPPEVLVTRQAIIRAFVRGAPINVNWTLPRMNETGPTNAHPGTNGYPGFEGIVPFSGETDPEVVLTAMAGEESQTKKVRPSNLPPSVRLDLIGSDPLGYFSAIVELVPGQ